MGEMLLQAEDDALIGCMFVSGQQAVCDKPNAVIRQACMQLQAYFEGRRRRFELPLNPQGTPFQKRVWKVLDAVPFGQTQSYSWVAEQLGLSTKTSRAVGLANGRNPISIIIPCHRIIGANGKLTGYAGGLQRKRWLLEWEQAPGFDSLFR